MRRRPYAELVETEENDLDDLRPDGPVSRAAAVLGDGGVVVLRVHPRTSEKAVAVRRSHAALTAIVKALSKRHDLPSDAYVEIDEESQGTPVAPFKTRRFLLPHQDGGHCSFLTPSRLDHRDVAVAERVFSSSVYWKRASHKLYQGFIITEPGDPPGETFYYDVFALLHEAFAIRYGFVPDVFELQTFTIENIRRSREQQGTHGSRYVTLGALLGSPELALHVMPSGPRAESEFWPVQYMNLGALCEFADRCPCGTCGEPGIRLFCHTCARTLGRTWPEFRRDYEVRVVGERHDLLVGNNLTQLHAADSSAFRTIRPMCIVLDRPEGEPYERWLRRQWHGWYSDKASVAVSK